MSPIATLQLAVFYLRHSEEVFSDFYDLASEGRSTPKYRSKLEEVKIERKRLKEFVRLNPDILNDIELISAGFPYCAEGLEDAETQIIDEYEDFFKVDEKKKQRARAKAQKIKAEACVMCGEKRVHRHHYDYDKPLDVFQLCPGHHMRLHALMRKEEKWYNKKETETYLKINQSNLLGMEEKLFVLKEGEMALKKLGIV